MTKGNQILAPKDALLDKPEIITSKCTKFNNLYSVSCRNDNEIWTRGLDNITRLYHLQGIDLESITTKSLNEPYDLTVLRDGELVHTDFKDGSVDINRARYQTNNVDM